MAVWKHDNETRAGDANSDYNQRGYESHADYREALQQARWDDAPEPEEEEEKYETPGCLSENQQIIQLLEEIKVILERLERAAVFFKNRARGIW